MLVHDVETAFGLCKHLAAHVNLSEISVMRKKNANCIFFFFFFF